MKKFNLATLSVLTVLAFSTMASAKSNNLGGGFTGPSSVNATTVEAAKNMSDDTNVVLVGYIEQALGGEKYMFKDSTGSIKVEIDHDKWNGLNITPEDKVELRGEVDKGWTSIKIDVDSVARVK